jgi:hypothetical protein
MNFAEAVMFSTKKPLLQYRGQSGLGGRTVRKYGHRTAKKAQKKNLNSRTVRYSTMDCPRIAKQAGTESSENRLLSSIFRFAAKSSPTATKLGEHDHKVVGELSLRGHRPI